MSQKKNNFFFLENHDIFKDELKHQNISYVRAYEKAELQFYEEKKFIKVNSNNVSILFYPTALCKLGPKKIFF